MSAAQPPHRPGEAPHPKPPATVVTRVNVNVETEVDVAAGQADADDDEDEEVEREDVPKAGIGELVEAALKHSGSGTPWLVITDININVETSVKVRAQSAKPRDANAPAATGTPKASSAASDDKSQTPADDSPRPGKKKRRKRAAKPAETSVPQPVETPASFGLNKLKFGEKLEIGVAGQVETEERARQIARQINAKTSQSLLGLALAGMFLPEQSESLGVVQKAVASVKAEAVGNELSISAAIPRETPGAIRTLVNAAIQKEK